MRHLLSPVLRALDTAAAPRTLWLRDDDAGWAPAALWALVHTTQAAGVPLALAAIPQAVDPAFAHSLCAHLDAAPGLLSVHQHGLAHLNHESAGRKCEFGPARSAAQQAADIAAGRAHLQRLLGARLQPFFTPPWNRCAAGTPALLAAAGLAGLSRSRSAPGQIDLPELNVDVDWCRAWREGGPAGTAQALAQAFAQQPCVGLMLHHAAMQPAELACLGSWLHALAAHPRLGLRSMAQLLQPAAEVAA